MSKGGHLFSFLYFVVVVVVETNETKILIDCHKKQTRSSEGPEKKESKVTLSGASGGITKLQEG